MLDVCPDRYTYGKTRACPHGSSTRTYSSTRACAYSFPSLHNRCAHAGPLACSLAYALVHPIYSDCCPNFRTHHNNACPDTHTVDVLPYRCANLRPSGDFGDLHQRHVKQHQRRGGQNRQDDNLV